MDCSNEVAGETLARGEAGDDAVIPAEEPVASRTDPNIAISVRQKGANALVTQTVRGVEENPRAIRTSKHAGVCAQPQGLVSSAGNRANLALQFPTGGRDLSQPAVLKDIQAARGS